jgi:murein DD-endopeptidase MepM/ murein hydrolase activator NlpD
MRGQVGDRKRNDTFPAWNKPFYAAAAGTVLEVVDDVPDNTGDSPNPANSPVRNARIILTHDGGRFSLYAHVQKGTAAVKRGDAINAGQLLGRIGNAGHSSEPHLHFAMFILDETGRAQALPMTFKHLKNKDGSPVVGVPLGALEYLSE